jgi:hypothetical protein
MEREFEIANANQVAIPQRRWLFDDHSIDIRAVTTLEIFDQEVRTFLNNRSMRTTDASAVENDGAVWVAT